MKRSIPAPVIAVLSDNLAALETHASLDNLFLYADAPGESPEGGFSSLLKSLCPEVC